MTRPVMFLRTAQTEQRIEELEKQVTMILTHLKLNEPTPSDKEWEAADKKLFDLVDKRPEPEPIEWKEPDPLTSPKQSKVAERVAKGKRG